MQFNFGGSTTNPPNPSGFTLGGGSSVPAFSFGNTTTTTAPSTTTALGGFTLGQSALPSTTAPAPTTGFTFGAQSNTTPAPTNTTGFSFGGQSSAPASTGFSFQSSNALGGNKTSSFSTFGKPTSTSGISTAPAFGGIQTTTPAISFNNAEYDKKIKDFKDSNIALMNLFEKIHATCKEADKFLEDSKKIHSTTKLNTLSKKVNDLNLAVLSNQNIQHTQFQHIKALKNNVRNGLMETEKAYGIVSHIKEDRGWKAKDLPSDFFKSLLLKFKERLNEYKDQIKRVDELLVPEREREEGGRNAYGLKSKYTPQMLRQIIVSQHDAFVDLTAKAAEIFESVERVKDMYRRECIRCADERGDRDWKDPFEQRDREEAEEERKRAAKEIILKKNALELLNKSTSNNLSTTATAPLAQNSFLTGNANQIGGTQPTSNFSFNLPSTTTTNTTATNSLGSASAPAAPSTAFSMLSSNTPVVNGNTGFTFGNLNTTTSAPTATSFGNDSRKKSVSKKK